VRGKIAAAVVVPLALGLFALVLGHRVSAATPATSQNGWTVVEQAGTQAYQVPGSKVRLRLRTGDAATVLIDVAAWFDQAIEDIDVGVDDWGWSVRRIEGSSSYSNHASGTAIDLNASKHPMGVAASSNLSARQIDLIHARLRDRYKGVVRWGGDYRSRPDAMHFEINAGAAEVKAVAAAIASGAAPRPTVAPVAAARPTTAPPTTARPTTAPPTTVRATTTTARPTTTAAPVPEEPHEDEMGPVEAQAPVASPRGVELSQPPEPVRAVPAFTG
jgi:hypothetical protein